MEDEALYFSGENKNLMSGPKCMFSTDISQMLPMLGTTSTHHTTAEIPSNPKSSVAKHIQIVVTNLEMMMTWSPLPSSSFVDLFGEQEKRGRPNRKGEYSSAAPL